MIVGYVLVAALNFIDALSVVKSSAWSVDGMNRLITLNLVRRGKMGKKCPFAEGWENQEGWLVAENGKLVCLDWDAYCSECREGDGKDYVFAINPEVVESEEM